MTHPYAAERKEYRAKAEKLVSHAGYKRGGAVTDSDAAEDKREMAADVHAHERHMHKGEKETKLRRGGHVEGEAGHGHLAKRARGGKVGKGATVNVIVAPQGGGGMHPPGPPVGGPPAAVMPPHPMPPAMPPRPMPMAGGPPGMPPGGAPGLPPGMMRKRGGSIPSIDAGAGGGEGRREKMREYGKGGMKPKQ